MCLFADAILVDQRGRDGHFWGESETSKTGGFALLAAKGEMTQKTMFCHLSKPEP